MFNSALPCVVIFRFLLSLKNLILSSNWEKRFSHFGSMHALLRNKFVIVIVKNLTISKKQSKLFLA